MMAQAYSSAASRQRNSPLSKETAPPRSVFHSFVTVLIAQGYRPALPGGSVLSSIVLSLHTGSSAAAVSFRLP